MSLRFYALLDRLKEYLGGTRTLASLAGLRDGPQRGVYFFFELTRSAKKVTSGRARAAFKAARSSHAYVEALCPRLCLSLFRVVHGKLPSSPQPERRKQAESGVAKWKEFQICRPTHFSRR